MPNILGKQKGLQGFAFGWHVADLDLWGIWPDVFPACDGGIEGDSSRKGILSTLRTPLSVCRDAKRSVATWAEPANYNLFNSFSLVRGQQKPLNERKVGAAKNPNLCQYIASR